MPVDRLLPTPEAAELIELVRDLCRKELAPRVDQAEADGAFPRDVFRVLGEVGLLSLPFDEAAGGGGQPYEVYLQALEEIAATWMSVAVDLSVHTLSATVLATFGTDAQRSRLLPGVLGGGQLGAYALSEPHAGSDVSAIATKAVRAGDSYTLSGTKAWISHGPDADFWVVFARTSEDPRRGLSAFHVPAGTAGISFGAPERKMGMTASTTAQLLLERVELGPGGLIGAEGEGMAIALAALDSGRLGIAACATGLAQAAVDLAVGYAAEREQFGQPVAGFQGIQFMLADMAAAVDSARATYLHAARLRDAGRAYTRAASIAKLVATDAAMKVTTDAVQVLGGYGYTRDFPAERYMREAKVTQIFEGTNQIQRLVIARDILRAPAG